MPQQEAKKKFSEGMSRLWHGRCALTRLGIPELLRATPAKPWLDCSPAERVDCYNGLLLEIRLAVLFFNGYISFDDAGVLLISNKLDSDQIRKLGLRELQWLPGVNPRHLPYFQWHREHVFKHRR